MREYQAYSPSPLSFAFVGSDGNRKLMPTAFLLCLSSGLCRWLEVTLFCAFLQNLEPCSAPKHYIFCCLSVFLEQLFFSILDYLLHSISASAYNQSPLNPCSHILYFFVEVHYHFSVAKLGCTVAFQVPVGSPYSF